MFSGMLLKRLSVTVRIAHHEKRHTNGEGRSADVWNGTLSFSFLKYFCGNVSDTHSDHVICGSCTCLFFVCYILLKKGNNRRTPCMCVLSAVMHNMRFHCHDNLLRKVPRNKAEADTNNCWKYRFRKNPKFV